MSYSKSAAFVCLCMRAKKGISVNTKIWSSTAKSCHGASEIDIGRHLFNSKCCSIRLWSVLRQKFKTIFMGFFFVFFGML